MKATISAPAASVYGADEAMPSMPEGMSVTDAIYHTVHAYPGGVAALAARMGVSANTLTHKANPNTHTHHLHPQELVALQHMSGNVAVLHAMAGALGYVVQRATPDQTEGDPVLATMDMQVRFADLMRAVADPLHRVAGEGGAFISPSEVRRADYAAQEVHAAVGHMLATMRAKLRPAPGAGA